MPTTMPTAATIHEAVEQLKAQITTQVAALPLPKIPQNVIDVAFKEIDEAEVIADNLLRVEAKVATFVQPKTMTFVNNKLTVEAELALPAITVPLPGFDDVALVLGDSLVKHIDFALHATLDPAAQTIAVDLTLSQVPLSIKVVSELLRKVVLKPGGWALAEPPDVTIGLGGTAIAIDGSGTVTFTLPALEPCAVQIGSTGIVLDLKSILILTGNEPPPLGVPQGSKGLYIAAADVYLPPVLRGLTPNDVHADQLLIGTGGLSGTIASVWTGAKPITIGEIACTVEQLSFKFKQNTLVDSSLACDLSIPYFDKVVALDVSLASDGAVLATFSAARPNGSGVTNDGGLLHFAEAGVYEATLEHASFYEHGGIAKLLVSGSVTPKVPGVNWPTLEIRELSIDSKGRVGFAAGWTPLGTSHTFDFYGAKLEVTQFSMGVTDTGDKFIALNGKLELIKGLPAGASVEGLRLKWQANGTPSVSFDGVGVSFKSPALEFDGHVSYVQEGPVHKFTGDIKVNVPAANHLALIGKAVFGVDAHQTNYFAIYVEGQFGTGIPLWATGLSLYGIAGLIGINYAPKKASSMPWYSMDTKNSWFHQPQIGATDIVNKWEPAPGAFAFGAGVTIGTAVDNGYAFNGKFLLLLLTPGVVVMIDGSANVMVNRDGGAEPQFHGLIVLDNRAGYFLVGIDATYKFDKKQGALTEISGSMEAFFSFADPMAWYLDLGKDDPLEQRIQASFAKLDSPAKAYFMLDAHKLRLGAWIGYSKYVDKGPVKAGLDVYLDANAAVNFKPAQFHGDIHLHGYLGVKVFKFKLGIGLDAKLTADVFKPFHILGELDILIETKVKNYDLHVKLEWGPRPEPPPLHLPELLPVVSSGITHPKSSAEWDLIGQGQHRAASDAAATPGVPVDSRPYVTFAYPMHDAIGVGVNAGPDPGWITIGDPVRAAGSARARYALTKIELYRDDQLVAACPNTSAALGTIFGAWAPAPPGSPSGQNKLLIGSKNPLDFTDDTASWNPWLSSNLPGYPCPDTSTEKVCIDFETLAVGQPVYGAWRPPQNPDFQLTWWYDPDLPPGWTDAGPHYVVPLSPPVQGYDRGLRVRAQVGTPYRAYVTNYDANTVSLVDLMTRSVIATMPAGTQPVATAVSPDAKRLYVCSTSGDTFIAFDTGTNQRVGNAVPGVARAATIALAPDGALAFVAHGAANVVYAIDLATLTATAIPVGFVAFGAALTPDGNKLYVLHPNDGKLTVLGAHSLATIKVVSLGTYPVTSMAFHPTAPRAWIASGISWHTDPWDTNGDAFIGTTTFAGDFSWGDALAVPPDGSAVYVAGQNAAKLAVFNAALTDFNHPIVVDLPHLGSMQFTPDGSMLVATNYSAGTVLTIDPHNKQPVFPPIPSSPGSTGGLSLIAAPTIIIDVPAGSSSVDITWSGQGTLSGVVVHPSMPPAAVASSGTTLHIEASALGPAVAAQGIQQIRLSSNLDWTLVRACATKLRGAGGLPEHQRVVTALDQTVTLWQKPPTVLDAGHAYELRVDWTAEAQGLGELAGWSDAFTGQTVVPFTTALPPALGTVAEPNVPAPTPPTATGLNDLSLYVLGTGPASATPAHQLPKLTTLVYRGYDIAVTFGEPYVDEMYRSVGRDLDLLLFDHNNRLVRDAAGALIIAPPAWSSVEDPVLTQTQARWIQMFNTNTCSLQPIDISKIATAKVLTASRGHVLAANSVYEARLVPQLVHQAQVADPAWTVLSVQARDYRISVLMKLTTPDAVTMRFRSSGTSYYELAIDPARNTRTLARVQPQLARRRALPTLLSQATILAQDRFVYQPGSDDPYRIDIEAVGSALLVAQNGTIVFAVADDYLPAGSVELHQPAGQSVFSDLGISDLSPGAPVAYSFAYATGQYTNFFHQVHSFQDRLWVHDLGVAPDLTAAVSSTPAGDLVIVSATGAVSDAEHRAYEQIALLALGSASARVAEQLDVTRLTNGGTVLGWLVRSSEPFDYTRTNIALATSARVLAAAQPPGVAKIAEADLGDPESVTVLARDTVDLSGYRVQFRHRPSALADHLSSRVLAQAGVAGDAAWQDYRVSVACRTGLPGDAGLRFRIQDEHNFYAFAYDATTGRQQLLKVAGGSTTVLASVDGDPSPGLPVAPLVRLAVSVHGDKIVGFRAGKPVISAADTAFATGGAAVWAGSNPGVSFEGFEVRRLPNEAFALFSGRATTSSMAGWQNSPDYPGLLQTALGDPAWGDVIVRVRLRRTTGSWGGLLFRYKDGANHYRLVFTNADRRLDRLAGGVRTSLWASTVPLEVGRVYEIVISAVGSTLRVYQDTALVCEIVDASFASGSLGLCAWTGVTMDVPQIVVYPASLAFSTWALQNDFTPQLTPQLVPNVPASTLAKKKSITTPLPGQWDDVRVMLSTRAQDAGTVGLVFGYQDDGNFYRLMMPLGAGTPQVTRFVNSIPTVLWSGAAALDAAHPYALTLDVCDGVLSARLDGMRLFEWTAPDAVRGAIMLLSPGEPAASFASYRIGVPDWAEYYTFGPEQLLSAGNRVKLVPATGVAAPNRRTSIRVAAELDDAPFARLVPDGTRLRLIGADGTVQHARDVVPPSDFAKQPFRALRKTDGTGLVIAPVSAVDAARTVRLSFDYERDNDVLKLTEAGEATDEIAFIDLPAR